MTKQEWVKTVYPKVTEIEAEALSKFVQKRKDVFNFRADVEIPTGRKEKTLVEVLESLRLDIKRANIVLQ